MIDLVWKCERRTASEARRSQTGNRVVLAELDLAAKPLGEPVHQESLNTIDGLR
jgi:hypothetical protein